jgi:23S rRNA (uracil1939-C5)-methyltransferase
VATDLPLREAAGLAALGDAPDLSGFLVVAGGEASPVAVVLRGSPYVHAQAAGLRLRAHQQSFFQANRFLLEPLVETVLRLLPAGGPVLDLYSGVGLFSLPLAQRGHAVRAAEIQPLAAADAVANAEAAGLRNVRVFAKDVESALLDLPEAKGERILLDPPRSGASRLTVRRALARRPASVTYVSCDPPTLGRDLQLFAAEGYRLVALEALDMFPDTFHVEAVAQLEPA